MGCKEVIAREYTDARLHAHTYEISHFVPSPHSYFLYPANSNLSYFIETNPAPFLSPSFFPLREMWWNLLLDLIRRWCSIAGIKAVPCFISSWGSHGAGPDVNYTLGINWYKAFLSIICNLTAVRGLLEAETARQASVSPPQPVQRWP